MRTLPENDQDYATRRKYFADMGRLMDRLRHRQAERAVYGKSKGDDVSNSKRLPLRPHDSDRERTIRRALRLNGNGNGNGNSNGKV